MEIVEGTRHVARETALQMGRDASGDIGLGRQGGHATLKGGPGSRMSTRLRMKKRARRNGWTWAAGASLVAHGALLGGLLHLGGMSPAGLAPEPVVVDLTESASFAWDSLERAAAAEALPDPP